MGTGGDHGDRLFEVNSTNSFKQPVPMIPEFVSQVVSSMPTSGKINDVNDINYLSRYSNNLIAVSPLQSIVIEPTEQTKNRLFRNYRSWGQVFE
jgi:hypothetical protein